MIKPIKLVLLTVGIIVLILPIDIVLMLYLDVDSTVLAVLNGLVMGVWLLFFTIDIVWYYLWPKALFASAFTGWNFEKKIGPTTEHYSGHIQNIPVRVDISKGRWNNVAYIYLEHNNDFVMAAGLKKPLLASKKLDKINNLPDKYSDYFVLAEDQKASEYFLRDDISSPLLDLIDSYPAQIYWEKDHIKIHLVPVDDPDVIREVIEKSILLCRF